MKRGTRSFKVGRDAGTGRFKPVGWARNHKKTAIVDTITVPSKPKK